MGLLFRGGGGRFVRVEVQSDRGEEKETMGGEAGG